LDEDINAEVPRKGCIGTSWRSAAVCAEVSEYHIRNSGVRRIIQLFGTLTQDAQMPHAAISGQTPDEIYFGTVAHLPAELAAAGDLARARAWHPTAGCHVSAAWVRKSHCRIEDSPVILKMPKLHTPDSGMASPAAGLLGWRV
jgi:hypothetical protein